MVDKIKKTTKEPPIEKVVVERSEPSCTIKLGAKGEVSYEVKAYAETLEEATNLATKEFEKLQETFSQTTSGE